VASGEALYARHCAACHEADAAPPLHDRPELREHPEYVAQTVVFGVAGEIRVADRSYRGAMEPLPFLSDAEVAALVRHLTGANFGAEDVAAERAKGWTPSLVRLFRPLP
jgi:mono/diheme cytochrome c family protein